MDEAAEVSKLNSLTRRSLFTDSTQMDAVKVSEITGLKNTFPRIDTELPKNEAENQIYPHQDIIDNTAAMWLPKK